MLSAGTNPQTASMVGISPCYHRLMARSKALEDIQDAPSTDHETPETPFVSEHSKEVLPTPLFQGDEVPRAIEAVLLAVDKPLPAPRIAEALGIDRTGIIEIRQAIHALNEHYEHSARAFRIETVAGGYRIMTLPQYAPAVAAIRGMRESQKLSRAAIETLAIVAYKQPITRVQIEGIRGVATGEVLRTLIERRLITIAGRAEELGRPMLYATSKHFLEVFGLSSLKDLPPIGDIFPSVTEATVSGTSQTSATDGPSEARPHQGQTSEDETPNDPERIQPE